MVNRSGLLPGQIPPQTIPLVEQSPTGEMIVDINWYLYFYNLGKNVLMGPSGFIPMSPSANISLIDSDVVDSDAMQAPRQILNAMLLQADQDSGPSLRDMQNALLLAQPDQETNSALRDVQTALLLAQDGLLPDVTPAAQPAITVTVGASPFTYIAPFNGTVIVTGGTGITITVIRQGTSIATGVTAGPIPASRLDQIQIVHLISPTVIFLPS